MRATRSASGTPCFRSERHDLAPRPRLACGFHRAGGRRRAGRSERHVAPRAAGLRQPRVPSGGVARPGRAARAADRSRARAGVRAARLHVRRPGLDPQGSGRIQAGRPDRPGATARPQPRFAQGVQRVRRGAAPGAVGAAAAGRQHELCGGTGAVPIRFTVTQPARVVTRAIGTGGSYVIDSGAWNGQVNLSWPARLTNGDPVPAGNYTVVVEARLGQNAFSASQPIRVSHGSVDTLPSLTSLPGYEYLPETEVPPQSWRPLGLAFLSTGGALVGTLGLESSSLGSSSKRELAVVGGAALVTGFVMTLRKPAPRPAAANILYNRLLRDQIARRNQDIAQENVARRQQVQLTLVPLPKPGGAGPR